MPRVCGVNPIDNYPSSMTRSRRRIASDNPDNNTVKDVSSNPNKIDPLISTRRLFIEIIPQWFTVSATLGLIFGGCCFNVFALEAIVKAEPDSGTLLTFAQFLFVAVTGYISQFDKAYPPFFLKPNQVPIQRCYNISVPIHIILRSGGSITTIIAGYVWGKRFSRMQIATVMLLTFGVIIAAWSDHKAKKKVEISIELPPFSSGVGILFVAQVLSAVMGLYTEETYKTYGPHWKENLFYSHLLALPFFIPFLPSMSKQFLKLAASSHIQFSPKNLIHSDAQAISKDPFKIEVPSQLMYLVVNVLTQYACIRGVNLLASIASALTVTIILNIRKLLSLLISIWLFENKLSLGTLVGACIVFFAGGLYSIESSHHSRRARQRIILETKGAGQN